MGKRERHSGEEPSAPPKKHPCTKAEGSERRLESLNEPLRCAKCNTLSTNFSKSQRKLAVGGKSCLCAACVSAQVADAESSRANEKALKLVIQKAKEANEQKEALERRKAKQLAKNQKTEANKVAKSTSSSTCNASDPSMQYITKPLQAPMVRSARAFFSTLDVSFEAYVGPTVGWRTVAKLAVRGRNADGSLRIGLFKPGSHEVIDCGESSPVHHPAINDAVQALNAVIGHQNAAQCDLITAFSEDTGRGNLRYLLFSVQRESKLVQLTMVWNSKPHREKTLEDEKLDKLVAALMKRRSCSSGASLFHSIWVNYNASLSYENAITSREDDSWRLLATATRSESDAPCGVQSYLYERLLSINTNIGTAPRLYFPPFVFRQANIDAFSNIVIRVRDFIQDMTTTSQGKKPRCIELYGGVGTIGLHCVDLLAKLSCSDENPHNKECFEQSLSELAQDYQLRASYSSKSASQMMLQHPLMTGFDLCIVDPPRKGLDAEVLEALTAPIPRSGGAKRPRRLIYVSCGFKAFMRDCNMLLQGGSSDAAAAGTRWRLKHAEGHVLFPGADHIETFAVFDRIDSM